MVMMGDGFGIRNLSTG